MASTPTPLRRIPHTVTHLPQYLQKQAAALISSGLQLAGPCVAPPNVLASTLKPLRDSLVAMAKDWQFLDDTERSTMPFLFSDHRKASSRSRSRKRKPGGPGAPA